MGGYHPTFKWKEILEKQKVFDYICVGEGEETFKEFLNNFYRPDKLKTIRGLAFNNSFGWPIFIGERDLVKNLDDLPFPARHLINFSMPIMLASRGCFYNCRFCTVRNFYKHQYRRRSIGNVIKEIKLLIDKGEKKIYFMDDDFGSDKEYVLRLCNEINKLNIKEVEFSIHSNPRDLLDESVLELLESAHIRNIGVGIQSTIDEFREYFNLFGNYDYIRKFFEKIKKHKFNIRCLFIINSGKENENIETIQKNIDNLIFLIKKNSSDKAKFIAVFGILVPLPGTDIEKDFLSRNIKIFASPTLYRVNFATYKYNDINQKILENIYDKYNNYFLPDPISKNRKDKIFKSISKSDIAFFAKIKILWIFLINSYIMRKHVRQSLRVIYEKYF
jgi:radical SAM superfamily enzyme YgiQ (UPF0313 family)